MSGPTITPTFSGEVQLLDWSETAKGGAKIVLQLADPDALLPFRTMTLAKRGHAGQRLMCVLVEIGDDEQPVAPAPRAPAAGRPEARTSDEPSERAAPASEPQRAPNTWAQQLHARGYFRQPALWAALERARIYTQAEHRRWIATQRCYGSRVATHIDCEGEVCAHHTPSAALPAAGKGPNPRKVPDWYTVPLCHAHHEKWAHGSHSGSASREQKQWLVDTAIHFTADQAKAAIKRALGVESFRDVTPEQLADFEQHIGFESAVRVE